LKGWRVVLKKFIALFVIFIMSLSLLACQNTENGENPEAVPEEEKAIDLQGANFLFFTAWKNEYLPEEGFSDSGDKMRKRYNEVGEKYNCTFTVEQVDQMNSTVLKNIATGENIPDLIDIEANNAYNLYKADILASLDDITTINMSDKKWGPEKFIQYGIWNKQHYGFFPYDWEFVPQFEGIMLFNNILVKQLNLESPYAIQERGDWNWANFKDYLTQCTQTVGDAAVTGLHVSDYNRLGQTAIMSNGVNTVIEKDGKYVFNYNNNDAYAALDYLKSLKEAKVMKQDGNVQNFTMNNACVFFACESWVGTLHAEGEANKTYPSMIMEDYGFMPFPYGPNGNKDTVSAYVHVARRLNWVTKVSGNDLDNIGTVIDFIFNPLEGSEKEGWKKMAKQVVFHHTEGFNNFVYMTENCNYDYSSQLFNVKDKIYSAVGLPVGGKKTPAETIEAIKDIVQAEIDAEMNS
jgi:hypothetical protein